MSVRVIVSCARCGKKYKGEPGARKFKCSACKAIFTFPDGEKSALPGKILCANCWHPTPMPNAEVACPTCNQPIHPDHGGIATVQGEAAPEKPPTEKKPDQEEAAQDSPPKEDESTEQDSAASTDSQQDVTEQDDEQAPDDEPGDEAPAEDQAADLEAEMEKAFQGLEDGGVKEVPAHGEGYLSRAHESGIIERRVTQMISQMPEQDPERERLLRDLRELAEIRLDLESQIRTLETELRTEKAKNHGQVSGAQAAVQRAEEAEERAKQAMAELTQFRELAIQMLEPLGSEFRSAIQEIIEEAADAPLRLDRIRRRIENAPDLDTVRDQVMPDLDKAEQAINKLEKHIRTFSGTFGGRLAEVIGSDAE